MTPASGQILTASLMDYCLPRAEDLPPLEVTCIEVPTASNRLGVKGSGQAGCIGAPQTVMNAVLDALGAARHRGDRHAGHAGEGLAGAPRRRRLMPPLRPRRRHVAVRRPRRPRCSRSVVPS